jgi:uncharacterized protein YwbE
MYEPCNDFGQGITWLIDITKMLTNSLSEPHAMEVKLAW